MYCNKLAPHAGCALPLRNESWNRLRQQAPAEVCDLEAQGQADTQNKWEMPRQTASAIHLLLLILSLLLDAAKSHLYFSFFALPMASCKAANLARQDSVINSLTLTFFPFSAAPYWIDGAPRNLVLAPGESNALTCRASGTPKPSINWLVNGVPVESECSS